MCVVHNHTSKDCRSPCSMLTPLSNLRAAPNKECGCKLDKDCVKYGYMWSVFAKSKFQVNLCLSTILRCTTSSPPSNVYTAPKRHLPAEFGKQSRHHHDNACNKSDDACLCMLPPKPQVTVCLSTTLRCALADPNRRAFQDLSRFFSGWMEGEVNHTSNK